MRFEGLDLNLLVAWRSVHDEHVAICEAALARNALKACRMTELHLMKTAEEVRRALEGVSASAVSDR